MLRSDIRFALARLFKSVNPVSFLIFAAALALDPAHAGSPLFTPWGDQVAITGPLQVRLSYTDKSGNPQNAIIAQLPSGGLPGNLQKIKGIPLVAPLSNGKSYFDRAWGGIRAQVCAEVTAAVQQQISGSPNAAYNVKCVTNPKGALEATFQETWENDQFQTVNGRRIVFDYYVPLNGVSFYVTSPTTCHLGSTCPGLLTDEQFTASFDVHVVVTSTSSGQTAFILPVTDTEDSSIVIQSVDGGDITGALQNAAVSWAEKLPVDAALAIASDGAAGLAALAATTADLLKTAIATGATAIVDQHLRDEVSAKLSFVSGSTGQMATDASAQFDRVYQNLYAGQLAGLTNFNIAIGSDGSFNFELTYPSAQKPVVSNTIASTNGGKLFAPSIYPTKSEAAPGNQLTLNCDYFAASYTNFLSIGWTRAVLGTPVNSQVSWGVPGQAMQSYQTTTFGYIPKNLAPNTAYQFQVQECDGLTCSPWSDWLATSTEASGSNQVTFWLDKDTSQPIGTATIAAGGATFTATVTIPPGTGAGRHSIHAAVPGQSAASTTINVCATTGCNPVLGVVNTLNGGLYPPDPPPGAVVGLNLTVHGGSFAPGQPVNLYLDDANTTTLASTVVASDGTFQVQFLVPYGTSSGDHNVIALEATGIPPVRAFANRRRSDMSFRPFPILYGGSLQASVEISVEQGAQ